MKKSLIKIVSLLIIVGLNWTGLSAIIETFAYFSDIETANTNIYQTGTLDFSLRSGQNNFVPSVKAENMKPGDSVTRDIYIKKEGTLPFKYTAHSEPISGFCDEEYYKTLELKVWYNYYTDTSIPPNYNEHRIMTPKYNGLLKDFDLRAMDPNDPDLQIPNSHPYFNNLFYGLDEHWFYFQIILPSGVPDTFEGKTCQFKFIFNGWQDNLPDSSQGFTDTEEITNTIASIDWTPPVISNIQYLIATLGEPNELKVFITWQTDENSDSFVDYGLDDSYGTTVGQNDSVTSHSVEISGLTTDTTYHFRVRSKDAYNNEAVSGDYIFEIDGSRWGLGWSDIVINEFLPNPIGNDNAPMPDGEWVELYNKGDVDKDISGWFLSDIHFFSQRLYIDTSNTHTGNTMVPTKGFLVVYLNGAYSDWLDNDTDIVELWKPKRYGYRLVDLHSYNKWLGDVVLENKSFARIPDGSNIWYDPIPTPGMPNQLSEEEKIMFGLKEVDSVEELVSEGVSTDETVVTDKAITTEATTTEATTTDETIYTEATTTEATTTDPTTTEEEITTTTEEIITTEMPTETSGETTEDVIEEVVEEVANEPTIDEIMEETVEEIIEEIPTIEEPLIEETSIDEVSVIEPVENPLDVQKSEEQPVTVPDQGSSVQEGAEGSPSDSDNTGDSVSEL